MRPALLCIRVPLLLLFLPLVIHAEEVVILTYSGDLPPLDRSSW